MLKKSLPTADALYPTTFSTGTTKSLSFSSHTDHYFVSGTTQQLKKNLPGHSNNLVSSLATSSIELISRGPDGHFMVPTVDSSAKIVHDYQPRSNQTSSDQSTASLHLDEEDGKPLPLVLSVDVPACPLLRPPIDYDLKGDGVSTCSCGSWVTLSNCNQVMPFTFPVLPHIRSSVVQPSMTSSTLLLQMEHEREHGNLSYCLKLAQEREELEKELRKYTLERMSLAGGEIQRQRSEASGYRFSGESRSNTLPPKHTLGSKACVGLPPSPFSLSSVHWEADTHVSSPTLVPVLDGISAPVSRSPHCFMSGALPPASSSLNESLLQSEEMCGLTLPQLTSNFRQHEMAQAALRGHDQSPQSHNSSITRLLFQADRCAERPHSPAVSLLDTSQDQFGVLGITVKNGCVEMSVDEPELEVSVTQPPPRPMLHQRIAALLERGHPHTRLERCGNIRRSVTISSHSPALPLSPQFRETQNMRDVRQSWDMKHRSKSLDIRSRKKANFLTPGAWISSLSQENHYLLSSHYLEPSLLVPQAPGSTVNTMPISPVAGHSCPRNSPEMHSDVFYHDDNEALADGMKGVLMAGLPHNINQEVLEVEGGSSEGVPDSGSSYSSYASSGRGSMEQAGGRLPLCRLSPVLSSPPATVDRGLGTMDEHGLLIEPSLRYKLVRQIG